MKYCWRIVQNMEAAVARKKGKAEYISDLIKHRLAELVENPETAKKGKARGGGGKKKKDKKGGVPIAPKDMVHQIPKLTRFFMYIGDFRRKTFMFRMEYAWHRR